MRLCTIKKNVSISLNVILLLYARALLLLASLMRFFCFLEYKYAFIANFIFFGLIRFVSSFVYLIHNEYLFINICVCYYYFYCSSVNFSTRLVDDSQLTKKKIIYMYIKKRTTESK